MEETDADLADRVLAHALRRMLRVLGPIEGLETFSTSEPGDVGAWGPVVWRGLHVLSLHPSAWTLTDRVISQVIDRLPCPICRYHGKIYARSPIAFHSRREAADYIFHFHNSVNERLGKRPCGRDALLRLEVEMGLTSSQDSASPPQRPTYPRRRRRR